MKIKLLQILLPFLIFFTKPGFAQDQKISDTLCLEWWNNLDDEWQRYFKDSAGVVLPIDTGDLAKINKMDTIDIRGYTVYDLDPLNALHGIIYLNCSESLILSIEQVSKMKDLSVFIGDLLRNLHSVTPLYYLNNLTFVSLIHTEIRNEEIKKLRLLHKEIQIIAK